MTSTSWVNSLAISSEYNSLSSLIYGFHITAIMRSAIASSLFLAQSTKQSSRSSTWYAWFSTCSVKLTYLINITVRFYMGRRIRCRVINYRVVSCFFSLFENLFCYFSSTWTDELILNAVGQVIHLHSISLVKTLSRKWRILFKYSFKTGSSN